MGINDSAESSMKLQQSSSKETPGIAEAIACEENHNKNEIEGKMNGVDSNQIDNDELEMKNKSKSTMVSDSIIRTRKFFSSAVNKIRGVNENNDNENVGKVKKEKESPFSALTETNPTINGTDSALSEINEYKD